MSLFGVIICAISVGIFKIAALGVELGYVDEGGVKAASPRKENYVYWVK